MSRVLKTKFPCRHCGTPCEVRSLYEGPVASCKPCSARHQHIWLANAHFERARKIYRERNGTTEYVLELAAMMSEPIELSAIAARHAFCAAFSLLAEPKPSAVRAAAWVRAARSWLKWGVTIAQRLRELTEREGELDVVLRRRGLKVIDGGRLVPPPEAPTA